MEGIGPVVIAYMHSYGAELRGGSENKDDMGGSGRMSSGVACSVRTPIAVEKVAIDRPAKLRQDFGGRFNSKWTRLHLALRHSPLLSIDQHAVIQCRDHAQYMPQPLTLAQLPSQRHQEYARTA